MQTIAAPWYSEAQFWQFVITAVIALAVGGLGVYATLRASNPNRRLTYRTVTNTSLLTASHHQSSNLTVSHGSTTINRPRIVEFAVKNLGRRDITASMFHGGQPIEFDLGVDAVAVLGVASEPSTAMAPDVSVGGRVIEIHPSLLARGQEVTISVLVDGSANEVRCQGAPLVDVRVQEHAEATRVRRIVQSILLSGVLPAVIAASTFGVTALLNSN